MIKQLRGERSQKPSELVRVSPREMGKWNCRSTIVSFSTHKLTFTLRSRLYNRCALMGVSCYDTSNDEIVVKMKQFFKRNFIYICLATACLSLVRSNIKAFCWFNDCSIDWDGTRVIANGQGECFVSARYLAWKLIMLRWRQPGELDSETSMLVNIQSSLHSMMVAH